MKLTTPPLTPARWPDLEALFSARGCSIGPQRSHDEFLWHGAKSMFDAAGFDEVARRKPQRPVVRLHVQEPGRSRPV